MQHVIILHLTLLVFSMEGACALSHFVIFGGTGKIGSAVAAHLIWRRFPEKIKITIVGRKESINPRKLVQDTFEQMHPMRDFDAEISYECIPDVWDANDEKLQELVNAADCLINTAGPYAQRSPTPLRAAIRSEKCRVYVDVADPLPFLETSLLLGDKASSSGLTALVAAGAFPGMSNVLAMQAADLFSQTYRHEYIQNIRFNYFTAGLGGSGTINLYITNIGFGEPMVQMDDSGELRFYMGLAGRILGTVEFFLPQNAGFGNELAKQRVGTKQVFAWPFPEAATVGVKLRPRGATSAAMGTAPDFWNTMLGILVAIVPRTLWRNEQFSRFLADFSEPLVWATDQVRKITDRHGSSEVKGETHSMRIDVSGRKGCGVSIVHGHDSFRHCVAQSCAEFALDCLDSPCPGVYLPEQRYEDKASRERIINCLTNTPGTFCYTGPVALDQVRGPSCIEDALFQAEIEESRL